MVVEDRKKFPGEIVNLDGSDPEGSLLDGGDQGKSFEIEKKH